MSQLAYFRLEIFTRDLQKAKQFYTEVLELRLLGERETAFTVDFNNSKLLVSSQALIPEDHYFDRESLQGRKGVAVELVLQVEDVHAFYQLFKDKNYPIQDELVHRSWGSTDFRVVDPDGYYLRITMND